VDLHPQCLDVVCTIRPASEVTQVELDLVPPVVEALQRIKRRDTSSENLATSTEETPSG
jgi:hypothetical protein